MRLVECAECGFHSLMRKWTRLWRLITSQGLSSHDANEKRNDCTNDSNKTLFSIRSYFMYRFKSFIVSQPTVDGRECVHDN